LQYGTSLCPAGHLPPKGGDQPAGLSAQIGEAGGATTEKLLISPLEGEMAGRPEGGVIVHADRSFGTERLS
jgi:hypothetical protein